MFMLASALDSWIKTLRVYQASVVDVKVGKNRDDMIAVSLDPPVAEVVSNHGQYMGFTVHCLVQNTETMQLSRSIRDASTLLMQSSHSCHALPQKWQVLLPNSKLSLKNDIIDFMEGKRLGWSPTHGQHCGRLFVNILAEVL